MGWTKRQIVEQAFEAIGLASYAYDLEPEQLQSTLRKLDAMMAQWNSKGIRIGYPLPSSPGQSDLDDEANVTDEAIEAIYTNLALRLTGFGRTASPDTKQQARACYSALLARYSTPIPQRRQMVPAGAGNLAWNRQQNFLPETPSPLTAGPDSTLDLES